MTESILRVKVQKRSNNTQFNRLTFLLILLQAKIVWINWLHLYIQHIDEIKKFVSKTSSNPKWKSIKWLTEHKEKVRSFQSKRELKIELANQTVTILGSITFEKGNWRPIPELNNAFPLRKKYFIKFHNF